MEPFPSYYEPAPVTGVPPIERELPPEPERFMVGCDLGQTFDYTALCVVQVERDEQGRLVCAARHLERYRGKLYPEVVSLVHGLTLREPLNGHSDLIVDATGVGTAVSDMFRYRGVKHKPVWIHGGENESVDKDEHGIPRLYKVPKTGLISFLSVLFHDYRFKIVKDLPFADILVQELQNMQRKSNINTGHQTFTHREGEHDDLVLAAALAAWGAQRFGGTPTHVVKGAPGPYRPSGPFQGGASQPFSASASLSW